ncbi:MAG: ATP-dependent metalloprotease, partial [Methyloprofundus sp.]|nr:ATP-dependent metalloprotease [Methyloprofundus sp.]
MNDMFKNIVLWVVIAMVLMSVFNNFGPRGTGQSSVLSYSQFIDAVKAGQVQDVILDDENGINGHLQGGEKFSSYAPSDPHLVDDLLANGVQIKAQPAAEESMLMQIFISWFPMLLLIGVWVFFMRQMQGGMGGKGGPMSFGKSKARLLEEDQIKVSFADVA